MTFGEFPSSSERRVRLIELMSMGVQIPCDDGIIVGEDCYIGEGTLILPGCIIMNGTRIGRGCVIGPGSVLSACEIDDGVEFLHSWADRAVIESGVKIGPFARLRPKAWIEKNVKIGNFVEIKNSQIGEKSKVSHLSYIGDTQMSEGC
ncbi:MAG: bifunctional UDP-N-acetylglucosamine diphosphorylase/glucosamine-1-phosphate N-acetyltransferase GlmU, partial [Oscillospiraceae bacterium]|nr:bifunctional UDP-N-acetylglucosamine diphosphorylase/glucosamine-1-phosphate N-acetyltransferase GlmU [Oscillospiraceae bacterium]